MSVAQFILKGILLVEDSLQNAELTLHALAAHYRLGVNAYVVKPMQFNDFVEAVKQVGVFWPLLNEPPRANPPRGRRPRE